MEYPDLIGNPLLSPNYINVPKPSQIAQREGWLLTWRQGIRPGSPIAYGCALAVTILAAVVPFTFEWLGTHSVFFAPYFPAVLFATLVGGVGPGVLALALGIVLEWWVFLVPGSFGFRTPDLEESFQLIFYSAAGFFVIWIAEEYRRLLRRSEEEESKRRLYLGELQHRVRNMMTIVQSIVRQSLHGNGEAIETVNGRIVALLATNELLTRSEEQTADVKDILLAELIPYGSSRIILQGESRELPSRLAVAFALVIHELATNAVKYGALSQEQGQVHIAWLIQGDRFTLEWIETGGPVVKGPTRQGLGTPLITRLVSGLTGEIVNDFRPSGLICRIAFDLSAQQNA
jgi:two-component sensor histidine kinase